MQQCMQHRRCLEIMLTKSLRRFCVVRHNRGIGYPKVQARPVSKQVTLEQGTGECGWGGRTHPHTQSRGCGQWYRQGRGGRRHGGGSRSRARWLISWSAGPECSRQMDGQERGDDQEARLKRRVAKQLGTGGQGQGQGQKAESGKLQRVDHDKWLLFGQIKGPHHWQCPPLLILGS